VDKYDSQGIGESGRTASNVSQRQMKKAPAPRHVPAADQEDVMTEGMMDPLTTGSKFPLPFSLFRSKQILTVIDAEIETLARYADSNNVVTASGSPVEPMSLERSVVAKGQYTKVRFKEVFA
jgi:hypothetical protein